LGKDSHRKISGREKRYLGSQSTLVWTNIFNLNVLSQKGQILIGSQKAKNKHFLEFISDKRWSAFGLLSEMH